MEGLMESEVNSRPKCFESRLTLYLKNFLPVLLTRLLSLSILISILAMGGLVGLLNVIMWSLSLA